MKEDRFILDACSWLLLLFCRSVVADSVTPWTTAHQASLSFTNSWSLLTLMSIELVMPSNHLILCRPLLFLPSVFPSIGVFSSESVLCIRWPKYWNFSFSISPSNEYSGLISFRMDWLDLLAVQGTLKSLLQHHSPKASVLQCFWWRSTNCLTVPSTFPHYESVRPAFNRGERPLFLRLLCTYREPHVLKPNCMQEGLGRQRPHVWFSWNGPWSPLHPVQGW